MCQRQSRLSSNILHIEACTCLAAMFCCLATSLLPAQDGSATGPGAIGGLAISEIAVTWKPAEITIVTEASEGPLPELKIASDKASDESSGAVNVESKGVGNDDGQHSQLRISGPADAVFAALYGNSRTILLADQEGNLRHAIELPIPEIVSLRRDKGTEDGIAIDIACEGLLPGFKLLAKVDSKDSDGKKPPRLLKIWTDDDGLPQVRLLLPELDDNIQAEYHLAFANGDGSRTGVIAVSRTGDQLNGKVRKVSDAKAVAALDPSTIASTAGSRSSADSSSTSTSTAEMVDSPDDRTASRNVAGHDSASDDDVICEFPVDSEDAATFVAETKVDWERNLCDLTVAIPSVGKGDEYKIVRKRNDESHLPAGPSVQVGADDGKLTIRSDVNSLLATLVPGTRSFWVAANDVEGNALCRVDLPVPKVTGIAMSKGSELKGPTLVLSAAGLLPEFDILYATRTSPDDGDEPLPRSKEEKVRRHGVGYPKITDVSEDSGKTRVTIRFPARSDDSMPMDYFLALVNPDGSRSRTVNVTQEGIAFGKQGGLAGDARPLPEDAEAEVPSLEFLDVADALQQARDAGFVPVLFDLDRLNEFRDAETDGLVVLRQGLEQGALARRGETLLLGIRPRDSSGSITEVTLDDPSGPSPIDAPLDPVDELGFVSTDVADAGIDGGLDDGLEDPYDDDFTPAVDDGLFPETDDYPDDDPGTPGPSDGGLTDDSTADPSTDSGVDDTGNSGSGGSSITVNPDPGVNIDPTTSPTDNLLAGILQIVLNALQNRIGQGPLPGAIGQAITNAVQNNEQPLVQAVQAGQPVEQVPVEPLLDETVKALDTELKPEDRQKALAAWRQYASDRLRVAHLDSNKNGMIADDTAVWFIVWQQKNGLYNPATNVQLAGGGTGNAVAVLPNSPISPDWVNNVTPGSPSGRIEVPSASSSGRPASSGSTSSSASSGAGIEVEESEVKLKVPKGKSKVTASSVPTHIRVPEELEGKLADEVHEKIQMVGLRVNTNGKLAMTDKIVDVNPGEGKWVEPSKRVELSILRRVPTVVEKSAEYAKETLEALELDPTSDVDFDVRPDDLVSSQKPTAGEYVKRGTSVDLEFARRVPKVLGKTVEEANKLIRAEGFVTKGPESGGVLTSDRVIEQKPPYETSGNPVFGVPGAPIQLVRVATQIPDLKGGSLSSAKTLSSARRLLESKRLDWEMAGNKTDYSSAKVFDQAPEGGKYIDRTETKVKFNVVVPVPKFSTSSTIKSAHEELLRRDLDPELTIERVGSADVVLDTEVLNKTYTAGSTKYAAPDSKVRLTVGRRVPSVDGRTWSSGVSNIESKGLDTRPASGHSRGTYVYRTSPKGGELTDPRKSVLVYPGEKVPDVEGDPLDRARDEIRDLGLGVRVASTKTVETEDRRVGQEIVDSQSRKGDLVLKDTSSYVDLHVIRYVKPTMIEVSRPVERIAVTSGDIDDDLPAWNPVLPYSATETGGGIYVIPFAKRFNANRSDVLRQVHGDAQFTTRISAAQVLQLFQTNPKPRIPIADNPRYRAAADAYFKARHGASGVTTFVSAESFAMPQSREERAKAGTSVDFDVWYTYDYVVRTMEKRR